MTGCLKPRRADPPVNDVSESAELLVRNKGQRTRPEGARKILGKGSHSAARVRAMSMNNMDDERAGRRAALDLENSIDRTPPSSAFDHKARRQFRGGKRYQPALRMILSRFGQQLQGGSIGRSPSPSPKVLRVLRNK